MSNVHGFRVVTKICLQCTVMKMLIFESIKKFVDSAFARIIFAQNLGLVCIDVDINLPGFIALSLRNLWHVLYGEQNNMNTSLGDEV